MTRTIITLDPDDRAWLMRKAKLERTPMSELVRRAVRQFRKQSEPQASDFECLLDETSGSGKQGDALAYQNRVRGDWGKWRCNCCPTRSSSSITGRKIST